MIYPFQFVKNIMMIHVLFTEHLTKTALDKLEKLIRKVCKPDQTGDQLAILLIEKHNMRWKCLECTLLFAGT